MAAPPHPGQAERLPELDSLRGIAAFIVLVFHALHVIGGGHFPVQLEGRRVLYALFHHTPLRPVAFGREAVLFFYLLSGYVLTRALLRSGSPGLTAFAVQRSIRLGLPVAATVLLSAALYAAVFDPSAEAALRQHRMELWLTPPSLGHVIRNALLIGADDQFQLNAVLWSLVHEWRLTVFLPLVLLFRGRIWALLAFAAAGTALGLAGNAPENAVMLGPHLHSTISATLYFSLPVSAGAALAMAGPLPPLTPAQRVAAGTGTAAMFSMQSDLAVYAGSVLLILLARGAGWLPRLLRWPPLVWLGRISFSLYLVHLPVMVAFVYLLHSRLPLLAGALLGAAAALPAAAAMHHAVEVPSRWLARRAERRLATPNAAGDWQAGQVRPDP